MKLRIKVFFALCLGLASCCYFPVKTTAVHLKEMNDYLFLKRLFYLGSSKDKHYFRYDGSNRSSFYWIPGEDLEIINAFPVKRNGRGVPAGLGDKRCKITISSINHEDQVVYVR